ncbi:MAG TPA: ABC transporter permease [Bryobacteraceae bacterium]|nr:ABC transporter permease [Bryobacteraceae bacterium]
MRPLHAQLESFLRDGIYALRTLRKNPAFTITAMLTLALGIGGNTAMFTLIRAVLLKPLAFHDPDRLVRVSIDNERIQAKDVGFNEIRFENLRAAAKSFSDLGAIFIAHEDMTLSVQGDPESVKVARVSHNFLSLLGVEPLLGRGFLPEEDTPGGRCALLVSAELWRRRFHADPAIAGRTVALNATPCATVGVLPDGFAFPASGIDAWITRPSEYSGTSPQEWRTAGYLVGLGRLAPSVSFDQARAEMGVLSRQYALEHPAEARLQLRIARVADQLVANARPMLWLLFGAVGFVLLIACANIASLLLARAASRSREFAVRAALGASRRRIVGQLLTESIVLAAASGALGIAFARWALIALLHTDTLALPRANEVHLDALVLAFSVLLSIAAGVLFGLAPSLDASRPDLADALRASGETSRPPRRSRALPISTRGALVVAQVALSVILLTGAALLLESFARLSAVDPGFRPANLLTMQIPLPIARYDWRKQKAFFEQLIDRLETLPGVRGVSVSRTLPMNARVATPVSVAEQQPLELKSRPMAQMQTITPGYFKTLGIPLRRGRAFEQRDQPGSGTNPLIINEKFARLFWPSYPRGLDPVGQHILLGNQQRGGWEIVGIVGDVHERGLDANAMPEMYLPMALNPVATAGLVVSTQGDPHQLANAVRTQVRALDPDQAVSNVKTMEEMIGESIGQRRLTLILLGAFASVALLLAVVGVYGVIAYSVVQRMREIAIRRALGARSGDITRLVVGEGLSVVLIGMVLGVAGAAALTGTMRSLLFQVSPLDPWVFLSIALIFAAVGLAASLIPASRANRVDPMTALR